MPALQDPVLQFKIQSIKFWHQLRGSLRRGQLAHLLVCVPIGGPGWGEVKGGRGVGACGTKEDKKGVRAERWGQRRNRPTYVQAIVVTPLP